MLFMKEKYKDFKFYIFSIVLFILPYYIIPTLVSIFFSIRDYINVLMKTSGPKNTYMNLWKCHAVAYRHTLNYYF